MQQLARDVEQLLQLSGALELGLLALGVLVLLEERQQGLRRGVQLEFLLGSAVSMPDDCQHAAQLIVFRALVGACNLSVVDARSQLTLQAFIRLICIHQQCSIILLQAVQVALALLVHAWVDGGEGDIGRGHGRQMLGCHSTQNHAAQDARRVIIVALGVLHKRPTVHIAHKALALLRAQQVKAAHVLVEGHDHLAGHLLLLRREQDRESHLLAVCSAQHLAVNHRRLPGLSMRIPWAHSVHLHICAPGGQELLIDVVPIAAHRPRVLAVVVAALVIDLAEQALHSTAHGVWVVDVNVVVLRILWLLHKRLIYANAIQLHIIFCFDEALRIFPCLETVALDDDVLGHGDVVSH
mmetsp:Transcript_9356/g.25209  ORF Transcript_9356/g.25209 Transcript_9356/m.25209 type:complete len:353 (-) Transcript_9356:354-1412(-)